jgi:GNAT superfamily N-acetyltransferase
MTIAILRMKPEHIDALTAAFASWNKPADQYARYFAENQAGTRVTLVGFVDGALAGYGNLLWQSDYAPFADAGIPEINDLNTLAPFRRRGLASAIIAECERIAKDAGRPVIGIGVGQTDDYGNAQRLYPQLGYVYDGRGIHSSIWGDEQYLTKTLNY